MTIIENVQQVARCHPDVHVEHSKGLVTMVVIYSRERGFPKEACGDDAEKALIAKYGAPTDAAQSDQPVGGLITSGVLKGLDTSRNERDTKKTWLKGGVLIAFERDDVELDGAWKITYEMPTDIGL